MKLGTTGTQVLLFAIISLGLVCMVGCDTSSDTTAHLSGNVTLDGEPIPAKSLASVTFQPAPRQQGGPVTVEIVDSHYDCGTVPKGKVMAHMRLSIPYISC